MLEGALILLLGIALGVFGTLYIYLPSRPKKAYEKYRDPHSGLYSRKAVKEGG